MSRNPHQKINICNAFFIQSIKFISMFLCCHLLFLWHFEDKSNHNISENVIYLLVWPKLGLNSSSYLHLVGNPLICKYIFKKRRRRRKKDTFTPSSEIVDGNIFYLEYLFAVLIQMSLLILLSASCGNPHIHNFFWFRFSVMSVQ